ncbi:MAG: hypothetical protein ACRD7E_22390 [Bryobacteraceae bacterium]
MEFGLAKPQHACTWLTLLAVAASSTPLVTAQTEPFQPPLRITVLEGQGAINNISEQSARAPVVQVSDAAGKNVPGATVSFLLPPTGPSGTFVDGSTTLSIQTNEQGRAAATGLRPNQVTGQFEIRVTTRYQGQMARAVITQTNAAPIEEDRGSSRKLLIIGLVAAGVAGGVLAVASGGGGSAGNGGPTPAPGGPITGVTPGSPDFRPPR